MIKKFYMNNLIYNIESKVFFDLYKKEMNDIFDEQELYEFFEFICDSDYFNHCGGDKNELSLTVSYDNRRSICKYYPNVNHILLVPWGLNPITVCHEIAHYLCDKVALDLPEHGPTFSTIFINLCFVASPALGYQILINFNKNGVPYFKEKIILPNINTMNGSFCHDKMCA